MSGTRRRRVLGVAVTCVAVVAAGAAVVAALGLGGGGTPVAAVLPPDTAQVTRRTIVDTDEVSGDLGYGAATTVAGRIDGVVTEMPLPGDVIRRGQRIYRVDDDPVVLMYGRVPAYRALMPGLTGTDVRQLERNLKALGYHGFTVDGTYSALTAAAVRRWQRDRGLPQTGLVELGRVVFAPGRVRVDSVASGVNASTGGGGEVLRFTGTDRQVTARLEVSRQRLARVGTRVRVRMPRGTQVTGRVDRVRTVVEQPSGGNGPAETMIEAVISLRSPRAAAGVEAAVVTVLFTASQRKNVLTVPVAALVTLAEGGYGVEVVEGTATRYVRVETGLFADGRVEISGPGLREGTTVGMPR